MRKIGLCIASGYRQLLWLDDSAHDEYHNFILIPRRRFSHASIGQGSLKRGGFGEWIGVSR